MSTGRLEADVVDVATRLLADTASGDPDLVRELLHATLPWVRLLPAADIDTMTGEVLAAVGATATAGETAAVAQLLIEWWHTADVQADPDLHHALTAHPLHDLGPVPRPIRT